jgi:putative intracellular protease/amidase
MSKGVILVVGSNADSLKLANGASVATGNYLNETTVPGMALIAAGYEIVLATPTGAKPALDPRSLSVGHFDDDEGALAEALAFWHRHPAMTDVCRLGDVIAEGLDRFAGVFVPGGHAPITDLMQDADLGTVLRHFHTAGKPTALLCHGPVAVLAALETAPAFRAALVEGTATAAQARGWIYAGYDMTVFSNREEAIVEDGVFHARLEFSVADALTLASGRLTQAAETFAAHVVQDRELITGQNPRSDRLLAETLIAALGR